MGSIDNATISGFLCRLCSDIHHVVFHVYGEVGLRHSIVQKINNYLPVTVSPTDRLPKTICKHCFDKVLAHHSVVKRMLARRKLFLANKHTGNDAEKQGNESNEYTSRNIEDTIKSDHSYAQAERRTPNSNSEQSQPVQIESTTPSESNTTHNYESTITQHISPSPSSSELSTVESNALPPVAATAATDTAIVVSPTQNVTVDCDNNNTDLISSSGSGYTEDDSIMNVNNTPIETDSVSIPETAMDNNGTSN